MYWRTGTHTTNSFTPASIARLIVIMRQGGETAEEEKYVYNLCLSFEMIC
jgi:hypothetical protein